MLLTRNSKRVAEKQNTESAAEFKTSAKCEETSLNQNGKGSNRNLNRACKQTSKQDILKEKNKVCNEFKADKKLSTKSATKSSVRLLENKLKNNEPKKLKETLNSKKNINVDKENNLFKNQIKLPVKLKELGKTKTGKRKVTNHFPLRAISDNGHVPIWAVGNNLQQKKTKKRFRPSDIYNIDKDEDLLNESPLKKGKMTAVKKQQLIKKISKKATLPITSHKNKFFSSKPAKSSTQAAKCKGLTMNSNKTKKVKTNPTKPVLQHPLETYETSALSYLEPMDPIPEPVDSVLEMASSNAVKNTGIPVIINDPVTQQAESDAVTQQNMADCINDCYSSFVGIDTSYVSLRQSVAKCLDQLSKDTMTPEKHSTPASNATNNCVEDDINECYCSFMNLDTSLRESVKKNKSKLTKCDKTPEKFFNSITKSKVDKTSDNINNIQMFLIPKMTSTPENGDRPIIQPAKNCGLKLSEVSAIPCTASRNIQYDLSECEISPIKPVSDNSDGSLVCFPSKEKVTQRDEIFLSGRTRNRNNIGEKAAKKVLEKNPAVKCSEISKNSGKKNHINDKSKHNGLQKENLENMGLPKLGHKRKGPLSPLKSLQVDSRINEIPLNLDENQVDILFQKSNKNPDKTHPKHTQPKKITTKNVDNVKKLCTENSADKNGLNIDQIALFESPEKEKKDSEISPVTKPIKDIFANETASSFIKEEDLLKVLKPQHCYQSPLQLKKSKSRTKTAAGEQKKTKNVKEADHQPKKPASRTKTGGEKQKTKEEINKAENEMEKLNIHFLELEKMDLCIE